MERFLIVRAPPHAQRSSHAGTKVEIRLRRGSCARYVESGFRVLSLRPSSNPTITAPERLSGTDRKSQLAVTP